MWGVEGRVEGRGNEPLFTTSFTSLSSHVSLEMCSRQLEMRPMVHGCARHTGHRTKSSRLRLAWRRSHTVLRPEALQAGEPACHTRWEAWQGGGRRVCERLVEKNCRVSTGFMAQDTSRRSVGVG
jgi:hypothetical protein